MQVLFATKNKAKYQSYQTQLKNTGIELLSLKEVDANIEVQEDGETPAQNAMKKALAYYHKTGITTIAIDDGLLFENVPSVVQPNTHVRRIYGNDRASDDELIDYYVGIVNQYGENGKLSGKWIKSIAIANDKGIFHHEFDSEKIFTNQVCPIRHEGYPLDSISIDSELQKYTVEITQEENEKMKKTSQNGITEFVKKSLNI